MTDPVRDALAELVRLKKEDDERDQEAAARHNNRELAEWQHDWYQQLQERRRRERAAWAAADLALSTPDVAREGMREACAKVAEERLAVREARHGVGGEYWDGCSSMSAEIAAAIRALPSPPGWTALSEKQPPRPGHYACVVHFKARHRQSGKHRAAFSTVRWLEFAEGEIWLNDGVPPKWMVTHWMQLDPIPLPTSSGIAETTRGADGYVLVPVEPTNEMLAAAWKAHPQLLHDGHLIRAYKNMLAAAHPPSASPGSET